MDFLKKYDVQPLKVLKIIGVSLLGLILLVFVFQLLASTFRPLTQEFGIHIGGAAPTTGYSGGGGTYGYADSYSYAKDAAYESAPRLSVRNVASNSGSMPVPMQPQQGVSGDDAEAYEVTQYNASIETRHLSDTCGTVSNLKKRDDVVFENTNTYDHGCAFTFKVKHDSVEEVLGILKGLDPKELSENTYTIKDQIEDFTSEVEVLERKRASIDETLSSAVRAYNEITNLATNTQNADALAKIIDSKLGIIERLTQERVNINEQLDRLARAKAEQLDRLDYTYFGVNVYENKFVDGEQIRDSWKQTVKDFVRNLNKILQDLTVNLILLLLIVVQWGIYAIIVLFVAKYGWKFARYIWRR